MVQVKLELIKASADGIEGGIEKNENITYYHGEAQFESDYALTINDEEINTDRIRFKLNTNCALNFTHQFNEWHSPTPKLLTLQNRLRIWSHL